MTGKEEQEWCKRMAQYARLKYGARQIIVLKELGAGLITNLFLN
jgi:hypothetical protein